MKTNIKLGNFSLRKAARVLGQTNREDQLSAWGCPMLIQLISMIDDLGRVSMKTSIVSAGDPKAN